MGDNPITNIDPTGGYDDEYYKKGSHWAWKEGYLYVSFSNPASEGVIAMDRDDFLAEMFEKLSLNFGGGGGGGSDPNQKGAGKREPDDSDKKDSDNPDPRAEASTESHPDPYGSVKIPGGTDFYVKNNIQYSTDGQNWTTIRIPGVTDPASVVYTIEAWTEGLIINDQYQEFINKGRQLANPDLTMYRYQEFNNSGYTYFVTYDINRWQTTPQNPRSNPPYRPVPDQWWR